MEDSSIVSSQLKLVESWRPSKSVKPSVGTVKAPRNPDPEDTATGAQKLSRTNILAEVVPYLIAESENEDEDDKREIPSQVPSKRPSRSSVFPIRKRTKPSRKSLHSYRWASLTQKGLSQHPLVKHPR